MLSAKIRPARLLCLAAALLFTAAPCAADAADACSLLSKEQVSAAAQDAIHSASPGPSSCIWSGKTSVVYVVVRDGASWADTKRSFQKYGRIETVSGVADDAFFETPDDPRPTFFALKGRQFITLRVNVKGFSTDQTKAALKTLATQALAALRS